MTASFTDLVAAQHQVISRRQALRYLSRAAVHRKLASGRWNSTHRGVYVTHNGPLTEPQRLWTAVLCTGRIGYLAGLTALCLSGLRGFRYRVIDTIVPTGTQARNAPAGVRVHRTTGLPALERTRIDGLPCTSTARAAVDAAQWANSDDEARAVLAACFQQRLVRTADILAVLDRLPNAHRHALIATTVAEASTGAHSLGELAFLELCRREGFPEPRCQVPRVDASGRTRQLDAVFEEYGVWVEIDGAHHVDVAQWWADLERQNALWIAGERVLRFPVWVVRERPAVVAAQVRAALVAGGWTG